MERKTVMGMILTLILTSMLMLAFNIRLAKGQGVIYIKSDGSIDPTTAAIQRNGDIYTFTDNLYDSINVNKSNIVLDGAGFTLQGPGTASEAPGIKIMKKSNITITNVTIPAWSTGIYIEGASNNTIMESNITNNGFGISVGGFPGVSQYNVVSRSQITNNEWGVVLSAYARYNTISLNEIFNNSRAGIYISGDFAEGNSILGNNITHNVNGIEGFARSSDNKVYHNNFIGNNEQVYSHWGPYDGSQVWDDSYPSGGNYWSDYAGVDVKSGFGQDQAGSDGVGDTPHVISPYSDYRPYIDVDHYPLMNPWTPALTTIVASLEIHPDALNLRNKSRWITAYLQLLEGYDAADVNASTILLNGTIPCFLDIRYSFVTNSSEYLVDHNKDGISERMVKFDKAAVASLIYSQGIRFSSVTLAATGKLLDGTPFEGTAVVSVNYAGDVNNDGKINLFDTAAVSAHWYPEPLTRPLGYDANSDFNNDGTINILWSGIVSINWKQKAP